MKKLIFIVILIIIIITATLIILITTNKDIFQNEILDSNLEGKSDEIIIEDVNKLEYPDNRTNSFLAKQLAEEYMNYVVGEDTVKLLDIVNSNYIKEEIITSENILKKIKDSVIEYSQNYKVLINSLYVVKEEENIESYFINLVYCNLDNNQNYEIKIIVQIDMVNSTFSVIPYKYMQKIGYDQLKLGDSCKFYISSIKENQNNTYKIIPISKNSTAERYFNLYVDYLKYDTQKSYYLLEEQYRQERFENIEEYANYLQSNDMEQSLIESYNVYTYEDYTQYVCIDTKGRYYIFNENGIMNYTVILDTYTIDLQEFLEKYETSTEEEKVLLNLQKCFEAINNKDYKYVYNKLDETFKANNFATLEHFENYMKQNTFEKNSASADNGKVQGDIYMYEITITDATENSKEKITKTFVMKLKEGTDFVMSFEV